VPSDRPIDGIDLSPLLVSRQSLPERPFFFYRGEQLFACRLGEWKAHYRTQTGWGPSTAEVHEPPQLFHLGRDPGEIRDVAAEHAEILVRIETAVEAHRTDLVPGKPQID
jgi:arylsulfatase A-like enzyme